eukprot:SAG31_NODE_467_length_15267_cov_13.792919_17_plen_93_part_00
MQRMMTLPQRHMAYASSTGGHGWQRAAGAGGSAEVTVTVWVVVVPLAVVVVVVVVVGIGGGGRCAQQQQQRGAVLASRCGTGVKGSRAASWR